MKLVAVCVGGTKFSQKHIRVINIFHFIFFSLFLFVVFFFLPLTKSTLFLITVEWKCWLLIACIPASYNACFIQYMLPTIHSWIQNLVKYQDVELRHKNFSVQN